MVANRQFNLHRLLITTQSAMNVLVILMLMVIIPLVRSLKPCPHQSVVQPCKCTEDGLWSSTVECDNFDSFDDLQRVFDNTLDYTFDTLILEHCTVPYLNSSWFSSKGIKTLYVENMTSVDLLDDVNVTLPSLTTVTLKETSVLRGVRWTQFRPFSNLNSLTLIDVEVRSLDGDFRNNVSSHLGTLVIQSGRVTVLIDGSFNGKTELAVIALPYNRIRILDKSFFKDQRGILTFMDFSYNPMRYVPGDLFDGMNSLRTIKLAGTDLKTLPKVLNLGVYLDVTANPLRCDCKMSWIPQKKGNLELDGTCESPPFLKSKLLSDLSKKDFVGCANNGLVFTVTRKMVDSLGYNKLKTIVGDIIVFAIYVLI